jgi:hypothetical protein
MLATDSEAVKAAETATPQAVSAEVLVDVNTTFAHGALTSCAHDGATRNTSAITQTGVRRGPLSLAFLYLYTTATKFS